MSRMRWLQWSTADLAGGLGGVEVHARSLARELSRKKIECELSSDPAKLAADDWDVILTHGSAPGSRGNRRAVRVHVLHGTTLGRMAACGEWTWPGGYLAAARELRGVLQADVVLSVNPLLSLFRLARQMGRVAATCGNGWDASDDPGSSGRASLPAGVPSDSWLFVGRGGDRMKAVDRILPALRDLPELRFVAAPGDGFEGHAQVVRSGRLNSEQVRALMEKSRGLLIPSRYEGHSLVVLEALSSGLPVIATPVGGIPCLPAGIAGLKVLSSTSADALVGAIREAEREFPGDAASRRIRAETNQRLLPRWSDVADIAIKAVEQFRASR